MRAHPRDAALLVDVVADVHDEVEIGRGHRAIGRVLAVLVVLAARDRELEPRERRAARGRGARAADGAALAAAREPVPVVARRLEARRLDVHRVRPVGRRVRTVTNAIANPMTAPTSMAVRIPSQRFPVVRAT